MFRFTSTIFACFLVACASTQHPGAGTAEPGDYEGIPASRLVQKQAVAEHLGHKVSAELAFWSVQRDPRWMPMSYRASGWLGLHAAPEGDSSVIGLIAPSASDCVRLLMRAERGELVRVEGRVESGARGDVSSVLVVDQCFATSARAKKREAMEFSSELSFD